MTRASSWLWFGLIVGLILGILGTMAAVQLVNYAGLVPA